MARRKQGQTLTVESTYSEVIDKMRTGVLKDNDMRSSKTGDKSFTGTDTFDEAVHLAVNGWDEGRSELAQSAEFASALVQQIDQPTWEFAPSGAMPHIPAAAAGVPDNMMTLYENDTNRKMPIVTMYVDIGATWNTTTEAMIRRGGAIVALVDQIEASGKRVQIVATSATETHGVEFDGVNTSKLIHKITIKEAGEHLDIDRVAFATAHPAMLRRIWFRLVEIHADGIVSGYGNVGKLKAEDIESNAMYVPPMYGDDGYYSEEEAVETVQGLWREATEGETFEAA